MDHLTREDEKDMLQFDIECAVKQLNRIDPTRPVNDVLAAIREALAPNTKDITCEVVGSISHRRDVSCKRTECWQNEVCWKPGECDANNKANGQ